MISETLEDSRIDFDRAVENQQIRLAMAHLRDLVEDIYGQLGALWAELSELKAEKTTNKRAAKPATDE